MTRDL